MKLVAPEEAVQMLQAYIDKRDAETRRFMGNMYDENDWELRIVPKETATGRIKTLYDEGALAVVDTHYGSTDTVSLSYLITEQYPALRTQFRLEPHDGAIIALWD